MYILLFFLVTSFLCYLCFMVYFGW